MVACLMEDAQGGGGGGEGLSPVEDPTVPRFDFDTRNWISRFYGRIWEEAVVMNECKRYSFSEEHNTIVVLLWTQTKHRYHRP